MKIQSPVFKENGQIPSLYTCEGQDISPELYWSEVPTNTKSLVLVVDDPDAPDPNAPKMVWIHWILFNIPPSAQGLKENALINGLPTGTQIGKNSWNKQAYGGPCPPIGRHRYYHKLYALDVTLDNLNAPTIEQLQNAMQNHIIDQAVLMGTYQKR